MSDSSGNWFSKFKKVSQPEPKPNPGVVPKQTIETQKWNNKGVSLHNQARHEEAIDCYDRALQLDPRLAMAWNNKGSSLHNLGRFEDAIRCYDKALELDPHDAFAWYNKASAEDELGYLRDAACSYQQFLALAPAQNVEQIEYAHKRLRELGG